jgi:cellulose synthase (UDP-forming)
LKDIVQLPSSPWESEQLALDEKPTAVQFALPATPRPESPNEQALFLRNEDLLAIDERPTAVQVALPVTPLREHSNGKHPVLRNNAPPAARQVSPKQKVKLVPISASQQITQQLDLDEKPTAVHIAIPLTPLPKTTPGTLQTQRSKESYLIDVMTPKQKLRYRLLVLIWLVNLVVFWVWWLQKGHIVTFVGIIINSLMLLWSTILPAYYFYFVGRMRRPNPNLNLPLGMVAIIVTKAPSEPWAVVKKTLEAMKAQDFPSPFDVWLADEDPTQETLQWCAANNVKVSCRKGAGGYHNKRWPRRERCKEGNLSYFYDHWGYCNYDFVSQLDSDHVPEPGYLRAMIGPFLDSAVGYVAAPSICDSNISESWTVRARLYCEASLHGSLQAGYNGGFAPLCIGSHYAVRTRALKEIGGLGPELAEDHSTTLMFNAAGWRGVFAFDAIAHGDGAGCLADSMMQEFQWSRSLMKILLTVTPKLWLKLPALLKIQFLFAQCWYPLFALYMFLAYTLPLIALVTKTPWVNVNYLDFLENSMRLTVSCLLVVGWIQRQGWFRPANAKVVSWEIIVFQFIRWPWVLWGVIIACISVLLNRELPFKVTPKGARIKPLSNTVIFPYTLIAIITAAIALFVSRAGNASGYYYFALLNSVSYCFVLCAITIIHYRENRLYIDGNIVKYLGGPLIQLFSVALIIGIEVFMRWQEALQIFFLK